MSKFLAKCCYFILPLLLLGVFSDFVLSEKLKNNHEYPGEYEVWNDIFNSQINADIAIYGSSRAWVDINPEILEDSLHLSTYNLGIDGHNFWMQYLRHKKYFKYNKHPEVIILSVDELTLSKRKELYEMNQFLPYMLWDREIYDFTKSYIGFKKADYFVPLIRYSGCNKLLKGIFCKNSGDYRCMGYKGMEFSWNGDLDKARNHFKNLCFEIDSATVALLEQFITEVQKENIHLIFVYTPEYIEGQSIIANKKEIVVKLHEIANKYSIPIYDYTADPLCNKQDLFYNSSHLNRTGSELFTNKFLNDLRSRDYAINRGLIKFYHADL